MKVEGKGDKADVGVCAVCSDKATGIHYRVLSCEGCKGFWRRTIQRNMGNKYTCKVWTEKCPITPETRGRCQRCRYLACTRAGMVADLVMADKERLSRLRLVDQNREKRRQEKGQPSNLNEKVEQDGKLLEMLHTLYGQLMLPTINLDPSSVSRAAHSFVECLYFQMMGQRDMSEVVLSSHTEVAAIHLLTTRPPIELMYIPMMSELSLLVTSLQLVPSEVVLCMAMSATRPRLNWPAAIRQELNMLWDHIAGSVKRSVSPLRLNAMLQLVQQVQAVTFYIGHGALSMFPPTSVPQNIPGAYPTNALPGFLPPPPEQHQYHPTLLPQHHPVSPYLPHLPPRTSPLPAPPPPPALLAPLTPVAPSLPPVKPLAPVPMYPTSVDHMNKDKSSLCNPKIMTPKVETPLNMENTLNTPELKPKILSSTIPTLSTFEGTLSTPKLEPKILTNSFYSPPPEDYYQESSKRSRDEEDNLESVSPSNVPLKKRKCNLYSEILQEAINSTLT